MGAGEDHLAVGLVLLGRLLKGENHGLHLVPPGCRLALNGALVAVASAVREQLVEGEPHKAGDRHHHDQNQEPSECIAHAHGVPPNASMVAG